MDHLGIENSSPERKQDNEVGLFSNIEPIHILLAALFFGVLIHGALLFLGSYKGTYDAYVHIFFAHKYDQGSINTWVYNWFDGFDLVSYPPLVHQLVSKLSDFMSLGTSYCVIQLLGLLAMITGVFRISKIWLSPMAASLSAFSAVFITSYAQAVHHFGQLPSSFAVGFAFHGGYYFFKWVTKFDAGAFFKSLAFFAIVVTSHHLTYFLFSPVLLAVISLYVLFDQDEVGSTVAQRIFRVSFFALVCGVGAYLLLQPFFSFVRDGLPAQVEIPHATRENFFLHSNVFITFFAVPLATSGVFLLLIPAIAWKNSKFRVLAAAVFFLMLFGLGGTTPVPKLVFGKFWGVFTYDRFMMWSTLLCLPFVGFLFERVRSGLVFVLILGFQASILGGFFLLLNSTKFQPDRVDFALTAEFLNEPQNSRFRYLTLGVGCQFAKLSTLTSAATVDGLYYTARTPDVLRNSGIEAIDFSKFFGSQGSSVLVEYLQRPEKYSLKYIVVNDAYYNAKLEEYKWKPLGVNIGPGLKLWETTSKSVQPLPEEYFEKRSLVSPKLLKLWSLYPVMFFLVMIWECITLCRHWWVNRFGAV